MTRAVRPASWTPPDAGITLRQLEYLRAVERTGSLTAAARHCGVSPQSLSEQLEKLESRLGRLVIRARTRCSLTPLGVQVASRAAAIGRHVNDIQRIARWPDAIRIGMIDTVAPYLMPDLMSRSPLRILPTQARTSELLAGLDEGRLDAAVLVDGTIPGKYRSQVIGEEELLLALSTSDPAFPGTPPDERVPFDVVADREMLLLSEGHCLRDQVVDVCRNAHTPYGALEASTVEMLTEMVARDLGITLVPAMARGVLGRRDGVRLIALLDAPVRTLCLTTLEEPRPELGQVLATLRSLMGGEDHGDA